MKKLLTIIFIVPITLFLFTSVFVFAATDSLPEPLVGQTQVTQNIGGTDVIYYGATTGNETVYNDAQPGKTTVDKDGNIVDTSGREPLGFDKDNLIKCIYGLLSNVPSRCFIKNTNSNVFEIMNSRTYYNGAPGVEVATLYYPPTAIIVGDAYLGGAAQGGFNYLGRHLTGGTGATNSTETFWGLNNIETGSQATIKAGSEQYQEYLRKIGILMGESQASHVDLYGYNHPWYLQGKDNIGDQFHTEVDKYPEGKIWYANPTDGRTYSDVNYHGKGTLIIKDEDATVHFSRDVKPYIKNDKLGIIVYGDVHINANVTIEAAIFATGKIFMDGDNITMKGSFVATDFPGLTSINPNNINGTGKANNLRFYYDYDLDTAWPPGFRYLNMPSPAR